MGMPDDVDGMHRLLQMGHPWSAVWQMLERVAQSSEVGRGQLADAQAGYVQALQQLAAAIREQTVVMREQTQAIRLNTEIIQALHEVEEEGREDRSWEQESVSKGQRRGDQPMSVILDGVAPPGMEEVVKKLKKDPEIDNPWALAWWLKERKGTQAVWLAEDDATAELTELCTIYQAERRRQAEPTVTASLAAEGIGWAQARILGHAGRVVGERP